jgi:alpha-glucuronidase
MNCFVPREASSTEFSRSVFAVALARFVRVACVLALFLCFAGAANSNGETGREAWLRYQPPKIKPDLPKRIVRLGDTTILRSAEQELLRGLRGLVGPTPELGDQVTPEDAIVLGTAADLEAARPEFAMPLAMSDQGFSLLAEHLHGHTYLLIESGSDQGVLYGVFAFLGKIARGESVAALNEAQNPSGKIRWVDQWDNLDGSIERGYAGRSIFFDGGNVRADLTRASEYARLLASVGINGCNVNNVNANPKVLQSDFLPHIARLAEAFRPWGVRLSLSVALNSPQSVGGLDTFDPLDPKVVAWWKAKADEIYKLIPDFAGFTVKADSEGQVGPSSYGRTPADAANTIARALAAHGGFIFYRAFVYNHHLDWRDPKADRARAAYDIFHPLDGQFDDNVIIQIKHGPIDFQSREPVSPLFSGLEKTNEAIELQVTEEYTGQQRHLVYLAPMWKEVLDFDMNGVEESSSMATPRSEQAPKQNAPGEERKDRERISSWYVKDLVSGKIFHRPIGGYVAVANVGMDENWLAHPFAMANLYAFGRLAWNPALSAPTIAEDWSRQTFGNDPTVVKTASEIAMKSWRTYENYTGFLGTQTLTDITGSHYGPNIESSEENGWGQWHRADHTGVGMDRSVATGTGFAGQYRPAVALMYERPATSPDELLLFFHHEPYTHLLHSGKTVIQHVYDSHYEGADEVAQFAREWQMLRGKIDEKRYSDVLARLEYQAGHAIVWRDAICNYFLRLSGIPDARGRAGHFPGRVEAEDMELHGYVPVEVTPWENASGGKAIVCPVATGCSASFRFSLPPVHGEGGAERKKYQIDVEYFDLPEGTSKFRVLVNGRQVNAWTSGDQLPAAKIGGDSSTRRRIYGVSLQPGDEIRIEGIPEGKEQAALDYVEVMAER